MKKISFWAKSHPWPARILIVVSFILLNGLGIITGLLMRDLEIIFPSAALFFFVFLYVGGVLFYPRKKNAVNGEARSLFYRRQKTCDMLLVGSTFLLIVYLGNHPRQVLNYSPPFTSVMAASAPLLKDSSLKTFLPIKAFSASMREENGKLLKWKLRKKMLKEQIRTIRNSGEPSPGGKAALIILSVIVALGLIVGVASLACSISCGGSEALAIVVLISGTALVVALLIFVIRRIMGKRKKQIKNPETEPPGN
ncbi:MAG: hypothetical protein ACT4OJ_07695 [Bacteroidota bacterium]